MSKTELVITSKVSKANDKSKSLKTTVPGEIREWLELEPYDMLVWTVKDHSGKRIATCRKAIIE